MAIRRTNGIPGRCARAAGTLAACAVAAAAVAADRAPPAPSPAVKAAPGLLVEYVERQHSNILYVEEKGGMVSSIAPPAPKETAEPAREAADPAVGTVARAPAAGRAPARGRVAVPGRP